MTFLATRSKVPEVTAYFWMIKVMTTGMGEAASDFLAHQLGPIAAVGISGLGLLVALALQLRASQYIAWVYWLAVVMVSVFGTVAADVVHVGLGVPYLISSIGFLVVLGLIFWLWNRSEGTLSIHSIYTCRRELFYWAAVLATFALGTAAGDMTAKPWGWGWLPSGLFFAALISIPALLHQRFGLSEVFTFWWAYILTRPLGASFADWMAVAPKDSGLGWGTGQVALGLAVLIALFVGYLSLTKRDLEGSTKASA